MIKTMTTAEARALELRRVLKAGPATVKTLALDTGISESRVRELLKTIEGVETDGAKPARFWIPDVKAEPLAPAVDPVDPVKAIPSTPVGCPHCGADAGDQTAGGAEGTFLGDACLLCHRCGKTYNKVTGEVVNVAEKAKRRILNPQPAIDKKTAAIEEAGGTLTYASRVWTATIGKRVVTLTSREFAQYTAAELVAHVRQGA